MRIKKPLILILIICLALLCAAVLSACGGGGMGGKKIVYVGVDETNTFTYTSKNGQVTITGLSDDGKIQAVITIPRSVFSEPVVAIADRAFLDNKVLAAVGYEEDTTGTEYGNLTSIGTSAFSGCIKLESFVAPASLKSIGAGAFNACASLKSFTFMEIAKPQDGGGEEEEEAIAEEEEETENTEEEQNNSEETEPFVSGDLLESIGDNAFFGSVITSLYIGKSVNRIGTNVFSDCGQLAAFNIHPGQPNFKVIDGGLYDYAETVLYKLPAKYNFPEGKYKAPAALEIVRDKAFQGNSSLSSADFNGANGLTIVGSYAFQDCIGLSNLFIYTSPATGTGILIRCSRMRALIYDGRIKVMDLFDGTAGGISTYLENITFNGSSEKIAPKALEGCASASTITLFNGVEEIGEAAFDGCKSIGNFKTVEGHAYFSYDENGVLYNADKTVLYAYPSGKTLKTFSVPSAVLKINPYAFNSSFNLTSVNLGGSSSAITEIGSYAFKNCQNLAAISIPESVTLVGNGVFSGCKLLKNFTAPAMESVPPYIFEGCETLPEATLTGVKTIGDGAYKGCLALTSVVFDAVAESIGDYAFDGCSELTSITFKGTEEEPSALNTIGNNAFNGCTLLEDPAFPKGLQIIGAFAFASCETLTDIVLPEGILAVRNNSFSYCKNLKNLTVPKTATLVGSGLIKGCDALESITVPLTAPYKDKTSAYFAYYCGGESYLESTAVPSALKRISVSAAPEISDYAFADMRGVTTIALPQGAKKIGKKSFTGCVSIVSLTLPGELTSIGERAFENCTLLPSIDIPENLRSIGEGAFYACASLRAVELPSQIFAIPDYAFAGCKGLLNIALPSSLKTIGKSAFSETESLKGIYLHSTITSIDEWAFHASGLTSAVLPQNLAKIKDFTFYGCKDLISVDINEKTAAIGLGAFEGCISLTTVILPAELTAFDERIFMNCSSLERIAIPTAIKEIPLRAFSGCSSLAAVNLAGTKTVSIGEKAFLNCKKLRNVTFSDDLTTIGKEAFYGCEKLISIEITRNVTSIGSSAFANCGEIKYAVFKTNEVPITSTSVFQGVPQEFRIYVPDALNRGFLSSDTWGTYAGIIINSTTVYNNQFSYQTLKDGSVELLQYIGVGGNVEVPAAIGGKTVTSIASYAFFNCVNIQEVIFPNTVEKIGNYAFKGCTLLDTVSVGTEGVASAVKSIGEGVFIDCTSLMILKVYAASAPALGGNAFENVPTSLAIRVPSSSVNLFITASKWKNYASNIYSL